MTAPRSLILARVAVANTNAGQLDAPGLATPLAPETARQVVHRKPRSIAVCKGLRVQDTVVAALATSGEAHVPIGYLADRVHRTSVEQPRR